MEKAEFTRVIDGQAETRATWEPLTLEKGSAKGAEAGEVNFQRTDGATYS
ncbi:hypothetical protein AB5I39_12015 [Sphingomonas sp. MMS24-J45]